MLNRNVMRWLMPALVVLGAFCTATTSIAQTLYVKDQPVWWVRNGVAVNLANGVRDNAPGAVPTATTRDTSGPFDMRDHWTTLARLFRGPNSNVAGALVQDTLGIYGTLTLRSTKATLDSISIVRQWSSDGVKWTTVDSIGAHMVSADSLINGSAAGTDSILAYNGVPGVLLKSGIAQRVVNYNWPCNPNFGLSQVTAQASLGFNFIRFIVTMTHGDFTNAGLNDGWTGAFSDVAVKEH
jgi:hypothetical protein